MAHLPDYFEDKGYRNPSDAHDGPFQYSHQTNLHYFEWLSLKPEVQSAFNTTMAIARHGRGPEWFESYPVNERLSRPNTDPSNILLVDIGGNVGHDLINFQMKFSQLPGKLIFEDLPQVVNSVQSLPHNIQGVGHDFFRPQPLSLRNAKAYYLRNVLHDWPDEQARKILENIRPLMKKDSILLVDENALPDRNVALYPATLDMIMMGVFSSLDRTAAQFEELLNSAGFQLVATWRSKEYVPGAGTLFEAVLKE